MASISDIIKTAETVENKPLGEAERNIHKKPTIVKVPAKASDMSGILGTALADGSKTVGDGFVTAVTSTSSAISDAFSKVSSGLSKAQGAMSSASSAASDPLSAISSLASEAFGFSVPTSPEGIASLLADFAPASPLGDGTSLGEPKESISEQLAKVNEAVSQVTGGNVSSLTSAIAGGNVSSLASSFASSTNSFSQVTSAIGALEAGGLPVDNVISSAITTASNPVQSSLQKVINKTDGTAGVFI